MIVLMPTVAPTFGVMVNPSAAPIARVTAESLLRAEPRLAQAIALAKARLGASEVWVFGSRARGNARPSSDWDLFIVLPDEAPESAEDPVAVYGVGRDAGLYADVIAVRRSDVEGCAAVVNTLPYVVKRDGVRLDV